MRTPPRTTDTYHLRLIVERMQQEGHSEEEIVEAVTEADDRPLGGTELEPTHEEDTFLPTRHAA